MTVDQKKFSELFLKLILIGLILTPPMKVISGLPAIRVDELLLIIWFCLSLSLWRGKGMQVHVPMLIPLLAFFVIIPLSILNGMWEGFVVGLGDLNQLVRLIKYVLILFIAWQVVSNADERYMGSLMALIMSLLLILSLVTLAQHFNLFGINSLLIPYVATEKYYNLIANEGSMRPVGFIGNPNALGFQLTFLMLCSIYASVYQGYKSKWFFLVVVAGLFAIFATLSRTAMLAFLVGAGCMLAGATYKTLKRKRISKRSFLMSGLLISSMIGVFVIFLSSDFLYKRIAWRFVGGVEVHADTSFQARLNNWQESYDVILEVPLLGAGPLRRAHFDYAADNEYLLVLRSYGILGLMAVFCFYFLGVYRVRGNGRNLNLPVVFAALIMMLPAAVFFDAVLFPLVIIMLVIGRKYQDDEARCFAANSQ